MRCEIRSRVSFLTPRPLSSAPEPQGTLDEDRKEGSQHMSRVVGIVGVLMALWMSMGHWLFGLGGPLAWWYVPSIGLIYAGLMLWLAWFIARTKRRGRRTSRSTMVSLILSWVCGVAFGFTVPNLVSGELHSIVSYFSGSAFSAEMSIALCNPFGIIAFALAIIAVAFAHVDGRHPKPEEDESEGDGTVQMVPHPFL